MVTDLRFNVQSDARGALLPIEFDRVDFRPERAFVVTGVPVGTDRGNHIVPCEQLLVVVQGAAEVWLDDAPPVSLASEGEAMRAAAGAFIRYRLSGPDAVLLVLAERPFEART